MKKTTLTTTLAMLALGGMLPLHVLAEDRGGDDSGKHKARQEKMEKKWKEKDTNGDGVIDKSEFLSGAEERFKKTDADGDGKITKEEMKKAHEERKEKWKERKKKMEEHKSRQGGGDDSM